MTQSDRIKALKKALSERILVLDGAMGTAIQAMNLSAADFGGEKYEGCNENLVLTKPDAIQKIHEAYLQAGADIVETDTFGSTPLVLAEYDLADKTFEINKRAAEIARKAAEKFSTPEKPRFVAGSMGPTTKSLTVTGGCTFDEMARHFYEQAKGLCAGGVDYLLVETSQDTRNIKAAILGIEQLFSETNERVPIAVSGTIEATGTMLAGQSVDAFWASLAHLDLLYIGLNCATGPEFMTDHIRTLSELSNFPVACIPNAGLPDENGTYLETPVMMTNVLRRFAESGWVNLIGGCCGTVDTHIRSFAELAAQFKPRQIPNVPRSFLSGIDYVEVTDDKRPLLVGERTNVIGSRKFKKLIEQNDFEAAVEISRGQIKNGAQVVDVCLANPDRDELSDVTEFLKRAIRMVRVPLMIDSTDHKVIDEALKYSQGKAIINSINLEDGEKRFEEVIPLARRYGAALIVGTIDEDPVQGMAVTRDRKLAVAQRSHDLLTKKYGVLPEDIYFDALVFPCATGDQQYVGSAVETIEGIRLIKEALPQCKTVLGISNVSFGLPDAGREVLNSVFLYHCTKAGLDMAIVNTELLQRYPSIPQAERELAENLLWNKGSEPIAAYAAHFRGKKAKPKKEKSNLSLEERLASCVVEGSKEGLIEDLDKALKASKPLEIINGPLMKGMDEVGRLFNANELIVAEVLQSAEVMKAAVSHLEKFMEKNVSASRGKVILATVKGDVHDIGKNLVEIVLSNNGFEVVNLGIKVPPEQLIAAVKEHHPQIIGLSGLLVKSAQQMVITAEDLSRAGVNAPMLVGGAALSRSFTDKRIAKAYSGTVAYASDAMNGLELAKIIVNPEAFEKLKTDLDEKRKGLTDEKPSISPAPSPKRKSAVMPATPPSPPPDWDRHVLTMTPVPEIWAYINPRMLLGRHLGLPNSLIDQLEKKQTAELNESEQGKKAIEIAAVVQSVKDECKRLRLLQPKAVYQFVQTDQGKGKELIDSFRFPRQAKEPFHSISDFASNSVCLFVVTAGFGVREKAEELKNKGEYLKSHALSALALETAEAYAEWLHAKIRGMWGFPDPPAMTMMEKYQARYQGKRYSFGYPACPDLEGQKPIFDLLKPEEIGVQLTDQFMMDPEASVSAIVVHHPEASYFSI